MRQIGRSDYPPLNSRAILMRAEKKRKYIRYLMLTLLTVMGAFAAYTLYQFTHKGELTKRWQQSYQAFTNFTLDMGFVLKDIQIEGRIETARTDIDKALALTIGEPLISINPSLAKEKLEELPWVYEALVERRFPDTIMVKLTEKLPMALWQHEGVIHLVDHEGKIIEGAEVKKYNRLPLLVGDFASAAAPALFDFLSSEITLHNKVISAVWVGERRWDIHLKNHTVIKLPEKNPEIAWAQLALIQEEHHILDREVAMLDFRLSDRIIVKMQNEDQKKINDIRKSDVTNNRHKINT